MSEIATKHLDGAVVAFDLDALTGNLELMADWKDELRLMFAAALNPVDMTPDIEWLRVEVERFKLACRGARS